MTHGGLVGVVLIDAVGSGRLEEQVGLGSVGAEGQVQNVAVELGQGLRTAGCLGSAESAYDSAHTDQVFGGHGGLGGHTSLHVVQNHTLVRHLGNGDGGVVVTAVVSDVSVYTGTGTHGNGQTTLGGNGGDQLAHVGLDVCGRKAVDGHGIGLSQSVQGNVDISPCVGLCGRERSQLGLSSLHLSNGSLQFRDGCTQVSGESYPAKSRHNGGQGCAICFDSTLDSLPCQFRRLIGTGCRAGSIGQDVLHVSLLDVLQSTGSGTVTQQIHSDLLQRVDLGLGIGSGVALGCLLDNDVSQSRALRLQRYGSSVLGRAGGGGSRRQSVTECQLTLGHTRGHADTAETEFVTGHESGTLVITKYGIGFQLLDTAVSTVHGGLQHRNGKLGGTLSYVQLGGHENDLVQTVDRVVFYVNQVTPGAVDFINGLTGGNGIAHTGSDCSQVSALVHQGHLQGAVCADGSGNTRHFGSGGKSEPCVGGGYHHDHCNQQHSHSRDEFGSDAADQLRFFRHFFIHSFQKEFMCVFRASPNCGARKPSAEGMQTSPG